MIDSDRTMMIVAPDSPPTEALIAGRVCELCGHQIWVGDIIVRRFYWGGRNVIIHAACGQ